MNMKTDEFNRNYEIDRQARGVKATAKNSKDADSASLQVPATADGAVYDANQTYHFFDVQTQEVRQSIGLRRDGTHLCTFGLRVVAVAELQSSRDDALTDGQTFFKSEIERLQKRVADYELEKSNDKRSLKAFLMTKE